MPDIVTLFTAAGGVLSTWAAYKRGQSSERNSELASLWARQDSLADRLDAAATAHENQKAAWQNEKAQLMATVFDLQKQLANQQIINSRLTGDLEDVREEFAESQAVIVGLQMHVADLSEQLKELGQTPRPAPPRAMPPRDPVTGKFIPKS